MKIWEHYLYSDSSYIETVLEIESTLNIGELEHLVYGGQSSGEYTTTLTVKTARDNNILDESTLPQPPENPEDPYEPWPDDHIIGFDNLLDWVQAAITGAYGRANEDYTQAEYRAETEAMLADFPADVSDVIEYAPRGLTNETELLYVRKAGREEFLEWVNSLPANKLLNHWQGFYRDFKLKMVYVITNNRTQQANEPYSSYGIIPAEWQHGEY